METNVIVYCTYDMGCLKDWSQDNGSLTRENNQQKKQEQNFVGKKINYLFGLTCLLGVGYINITKQPYWLIRTKKNADTKMWPIFMVIIQCVQQGYVYKKSNSESFCLHFFVTLMYFWFNCDLLTYLSQLMSENPWLCFV